MTRLPHVAAGGVAPPDTGVDWIVESYHPTDGDTVRCHLYRSAVYTEERVASGLLCTVHAHYRTDPDVWGEYGEPLRVINLDTPELHSHDPNERAAAQRASADTEQWLAEHMTGPGVGVTVWPGGGFDRSLADFYSLADRGDTLTQWMLGRGWLPYVRGQ